ncbi:hypothetical protein [Thiobacillus sp.]
MQKQQFEHFAPVIRALTAAELNGAPSLNEKLLVARESNLDVCYAPFEYVNPTARVVIVGITPGRTQMLNAIKEARRQLDKGANSFEALKAAKQTGAFSGAMRPNLVGMLNGIGLNRWLGIASCDALFGPSAHLVQTASVLRNPVFVGGGNYNGTPNMTKHPLLQQHLLTHFGEDVKALSEAVFIPLGNKVAEAMHFLAERGLLNPDRILDGLPHPSGANAERIAYFLGKKNRDALSSKTNPEKLDKAKSLIIGRVLALA